LCTSLKYCVARSDSPVCIDRNKAVLNSSPDLPFSLLFVQLIIAVILLHAGALFTTKIEIPTIEWHTAKKLTPVIIINVAGLAFNMLCLRDVEASFFQVSGMVCVEIFLKQRTQIARGLVLPLTITVSSVSTRSKPSVQVLVAAAVVALGFFVGVAPEHTLPAASMPSLLSLFYGFLSSLFIAIHAVLIKSSLPHCSNSTIQLAYWTNAGSAIFLAPFILFTGEPVKLLALASDPTRNMGTLLWGSLITGVFGYLLCVAGLLSIKVTSPITHMFSSVSPFINVVYLSYS
jgi:GDP-fucose transporter C1